MGGPRPAVSGAPPDPQEIAGFLGDPSAHCEVAPDARQRALKRRVEHVIRGARKGWPPGPEGAGRRVKRKEEREAGAAEEGGVAFPLLSTAPSSCVALRTIFSRTLTTSAPVRVRSSASQMRP